MKVGDLAIDVVKKDIKNLHLSVHPPDGRVRIASPLRIDDETIRLFAIRFKLTLHCLIRLPNTLFTI